MNLKKYLRNEFRMMEEAASTEPPAGETTPPAEEAPPEPAGEPPISLTAEPEDPNVEKEKNFEDFINSLPEDLKDDPSLKVHKNFETLAKSYVHAQKSIGADKVIVPGKNATPEDWSNFFKKAGAPDDPSAYSIDLGEETPLSPEFIDAFKPAAKELGLLPQQAQGLMDWYNSYSKEQMSSYSAQMENSKSEGMDELRKEWGLDFANNITKARQAVDLLASPDLKDYLNTTGLHDDPRMFKVWATIAETMGEDQFRGPTSETKLGVTAEDAQEELNSILGDHSGPYFDKTNAAHKQTVKRVQQLYNVLG